MSVEQFVAFRRNTLPTTGTLDAEAKRLGFSICIDPGDLGTHTGFLPVRLNDVDTGFEWLIEPAGDFVDWAPDLEGCDAVAALRTGSDEQEGQCAMIVAATLLSLCRGLYFDEYGTVHKTPEPILDEVRRWMNG